MRTMMLKHKLLFNVKLKDVKCGQLAHSHQPDVVWLQGGSSEVIFYEIYHLWKFKNEPQREATADKKKYKLSLHIVNVSYRNTFRSRDAPKKFFLGFCFENFLIVADQTFYPEIEENDQSEYSLNLSKFQPSFSENKMLGVLYRIIE